MNKDHGPIIINAQHRATLAQANTNCAEAAAANAATQALEGDTYMAAGAVKAGWLFLKRSTDLTAEIDILQIATDIMRERQIATERSLLRTTAEIENSLAETPLHNGTVLYYASVQQSLSARNEAEKLERAIQGLPQSEREMHTALIATMENLVVQPPIHGDHEPAASRPDIESGTALARAQAEATLRRCRTHWQAGLEIVHSPLARMARNEQFDAGEISPVLPATMAYRIPIAQEDGTGDALCLAVTAFQHDHVIYVKCCTEPYPLGFPEDRARNIARINQETLNEMLKDEHEFTETETNHLLRQAERAVALAENGLHTANFTGPMDTADAVTKAGADAGTGRLIAKHLTGGNPALSDMANGPASSVDAGRALAVLREAKAQGLDSTTIRWLAHAMGQPPEEETAGEDLTKEQRQALIRTAQEAGISPERAQAAAKRSRQYF